MIREAIAIASAWALFAIVHSLTITDRFQIGCRNVFGKRRFDAWHRLAYTFVSIGTFLTLIAYLRTLHDRSLYSLTGFPRAALRLVQLGALVFLLRTPLSILDFLGVRSVLGPPGSRQTGPTGWSVIRSTSVARRFWSSSRTRRSFPPSRR